MKPTIFYRRYCANRLNDDGESMSIKYYSDLIQGSDEWLAARCGLLTASEMKHVITATLKTADNEKTRSHAYELAAQRATQYVEPAYIGGDMLRGMDDEIEAKVEYGKRYAPVNDMGFITNDKWGFTLGCSPDGLVGDIGAIECKSRCQKYQMQTIVENMVADEGQTIPSEFVIQVQTIMLVAELQWVDFISYCGGMPMAVIRVHPMPQVHDAIIKAATAFEAKIQSTLAMYQVALATKQRLTPTVRRVFEDMHV